MLTLVLGGARSGKSTFAVDQAARLAAVAGDPDAVAFVATAPRIDGDTDLDTRIARHRAERPAGWTTVEEPLDLSGALARCGAAVVVVDCLTLWVSNLVWRGDAPDTVVELARVAAGAAAARRSPTIVVSNEVGLGIHPATADGREFRDTLGRVNQVWAAAAHRSLFLVAGRGMVLEDPVVLA